MGDAVPPRPRPTTPLVQPLADSNRLDSFLCRFVKQGFWTFPLIRRPCGPTIAADMEHAVQ